MLPDPVDGFEQALGEFHQAPAEAMVGRLDDPERLRLLRSLEQLLRVMQRDDAVALAMDEEQRNGAQRRLR